MATRTKSQNARIADRRRVVNIDHSLQDYTTGNGPMPVLKKPPSYAVRTVFEKYNLNADDFYPPTMSKARKLELHQQKQAQWRERYGKEAIKSTKLYKPTKKEEKQVDSYYNMDQSEQLTEHEKYFIRKDIKEGFRCGICHAMFEQGESRTPHTWQDVTIYFHISCVKAINDQP